MGTFGETEKTPKQASQTPGKNTDITLHWSLHTPPTEMKYIQRKEPSIPLIRMMADSCLFQSLCLTTGKWRTSYMQFSQQTFPRDNEWTYCFENVLDSKES